MSEKNFLELKKTNYEEITNSLDKLANLEETEIAIHLNEEEIEFILEKISFLLLSLLP